MKWGVLVDTGPLVALLNHRDRYHGWVTLQAGEIRRPLFTCEAVIVEAHHLLRQAPAGCSAIMDMLERDILRIPFRLAEEAAPVAALMARYADVPMSLADACLVRMSELSGEGGGTVFTLDSDFRIYRRSRRQKIPVLMPPGP